LVLTFARTPPHPIDFQDLPFDSPLGYDLVVVKDALADLGFFPMQLLQNFSLYPTGRFLHNTQ